jgi:hypothetical protein
VDGVEGVDVGAENSIGFAVEDAGDVGECNGPIVSIWSRCLYLLGHHQPS